MVEVKVGDWVRLVGPKWAEYADGGYGVGSKVQVTAVCKGGGIWAGVAGTVGLGGVLYGLGNVEDYAVEPLEGSGAVVGGSFEGKVRAVLDGMADLLVGKNEAYGNSALDPVRIFSKSDTTEQLYVRLDDKLNRVKQGHEFPGDDTIRDIIGYCTLILIAREGGQ